VLFVLLLPPHQLPGSLFICLALMSQPCAVTWALQSMCMHAIILRYLNTHAWLSYIYTRTCLRAYTHAHAHTCKPAHNLPSCSRSLLTPSRAGGCKRTRKHTPHTTHTDAGLHTCCRPAPGFPYPLDEARTHACTRMYTHIKTNTHVMHT